MYWEIVKPLTENSQNTHTNLALIEASYIVYIWRREQWNLLIIKHLVYEKIKPILIYNCQAIIIVDIFSLPDIYTN